MRAAPESGSGAGGRRRYLVALLVPPPWRDEIDGLRRALASASLGRIDPHVTVLAPRNVAPARQPELAPLLRRGAGTAGPLRLKLGPPRTFAPRTPVVFLAVDGADEELEDLRRSLGTGPLEPPAGRQQRPFVPHLTLTGDADAARAARLVEDLGAYRAEVVIDTVTLLEQDHSSPRRPWHPVAEARLGRPAVLGRGGLELELSLTRRPAPDEQAWFDEEWLCCSTTQWGPGFTPDEAFWAVARAGIGSSDGGGDGSDGDSGAGAGSRPSGATVVGVASGSVRPSVLHVARLVVGRDARRRGVGSQLMRFIERLASERGCDTVRVETLADGAAQGFHASLGFEVTAVLPHWRQGRDFVVMERAVPAR